MSWVTTTAIVTVNGAAVGSVYGLIAISYYLMYSVRGAVSFAQGDLTMLAGLLLIWFMSLLSSYWVSLVLAILVICAISALTERWCIRPAVKQGRRGLGWILATVGLAMFLSNTATILWGNVPARIPKLIDWPGVRLGLLSIKGDQLAAIGFGLLVVVAMKLFMSRTIFGKAIRVTAADAVAAELVGITSNAVATIVFLLSGGLATVSMLLIAPLTFISPQLGFMLGLKGFAAATVGGLDRAEGAFLGGILLGVLESLGSFFLWSGLKDAIAFFVLGVVILVRPGGLFGGKMQLR